MRPSQAEQIGHWQNWQTNQIQNSSRQIQRVCQWSYETGPLSSPHLNNRTAQSPSSNYPNNPNNFCYDNSVFRYKLVRALDGPGCQPKTPALPVRPERRPPSRRSRGNGNLQPAPEVGGKRPNRQRAKRGFWQSFSIAGPATTSADLAVAADTKIMFFRYERTANFAKTENLKCPVCPLAKAADDCSWRVSPIIHWDHAGT